MSADYGFSLTTFSPSGKLLQIEYALNAANQHGRLAIGFRCKDGIVLCVEKKLGSSIIDEESVRKIHQITDYICITYSGMPADFDLLQRRARKIAVYYELTYKEQISVMQLAKEIAQIMQEYTQSGGVRPFGCCLLLAGVHDGRYELYQIDPSGSYFAWKATAIGKHADSAKLIIDKRYREDLSNEDAAHNVVLTMKELAESQLDQYSVEMAICQDGNISILKPAEVMSYLNDSNM